jgi:hypothetical protein
MESLVPVEIIERKILLIRGNKVMLDTDLADLYGVETRSLVQAVKLIPYVFLPTLCSSLAKRNLNL